MQKRKRKKKEKKGKGKKNLERYTLVHYLCTGMYPLGSEEWLGGRWEMKEDFEACGYTGETFESDSRKHFRGV
jgi:hypothetical protein